MWTLLRFWPIILLLAAIAAAWASGAIYLLRWDALAHNQAALTDWVAAHPALAPVLYVLIYATTVLLSLPQGALLTVTGGLLFGTLTGGSLAAISSTTGAIALFLAVRYHLADAIARRHNRFLDAISADCGATASATFWPSAWCPPSRSGW